MFAVAQLKHTYIYDDSGVELHCLKSHNEPQILDFLPYHYLLVSLVQLRSISELTPTSPKKASLHTKMYRRVNWSNRSGVIQLRCV